VEARHGGVAEPRTGLLYTISRFGSGLPAHTVLEKERGDPKRETQWQAQNETAETREANRDNEEKMTDKSKANEPANDDTMQVYPVYEWYENIRNRSRMNHEMLDWRTHR
jgi:hypothetical protein